MVIGITGGVGCGKSTVLNLLEEKYGAKIIEADALGHEAMKPGSLIKRFAIHLVLTSQERMDRFCVLCLRIKFTRMTTAESG